jgi:hypothetical protein
LETPSVAVPPTKTLPEYCASLTVPVSNTSIEGIPDTSLTEKIVPVKSFVTENNCPAEPSNDNVPLEVGKALTVIGNKPAVFAPVNTILGSSVVDPVLGVIKIFLSEFAMLLFFYKPMWYLLDSETTTKCMEVLLNF